MAPDPEKSGVVEDQPTAAGRRRGRSAADNARAQALERLRLRMRGGRRGMEGGGFQIKMEEPIYDIVDKDQYEALVKKRREEVNGFIVDDNGLGYGDEGQEEDWTISGVAPSSEESEGENERPKRKRGNSNSEKKDKEVTKKPSALASAAALMGKQKISSMFTTSVFKKDRVNNLPCDSIVDDVIAEFAPDESDREKRRRISTNCAVKISSNLGFLPVKVENENGISRSHHLNVRKGCSEVNGIQNRISSDVSTDYSSKQCENVITEQNTLPCAEGEAISNSVEVTGDNVILEHAKESLEKCAEMNVNCSLKEVDTKLLPLNAKIVEVKDSTFSATLGWQAVRSAGENLSTCSQPMENQSIISDDHVEFELETDGSMPFYILDAHEEAYGVNCGNVFLFGKVKSGGTYHSCCVVVKNMQRCVYAIPSLPFTQDETIAELEKSVEECQLSLTTYRDLIAKQEKESGKSNALTMDHKEKMAKLEEDVEKYRTALCARLHDLASELKAEVRNELLERKVSNFIMIPVKRNYAFERSEVPHGENYALKINYPFKDPPLPSDLKGKTFCALLGTQNSAMEVLLVKRKIKGPSWLSISKFSNCTFPQHVSWCKFEIVVENPKDIQVLTSSKNVADIPPVVVTAINLKTIINEKHNTNEIVSASVVCCKRAKIDNPMVASEWNRPGMLSHFTVVCKPDGGIFPMGFTKEAADRNAKAGSNVVCYESSQRALVNRLMLELHKLDSDVLVGHNISGFDLDILFHSVQTCRVASNMWSKIGRLKRSSLPKLNKGSSTFGSGASPGIMSCLAGRLLCDTYLCSRDLLKEVSYSLTQLARTQLNKDRKEITPHDIPQMFQSSESLMELVECGETDAWLSMELMFHLSILPLTRQLTNISGNLWNKTLQMNRAQRVEYLLLHAFHARKFIVPDKFSAQSKDSKSSKSKTVSGVENKEVEIYGMNVDDEHPGNDDVKTKKGPSYSGGLVLEPKKGLYDKYVLLLDFNSLYPSIIQEYNICFTTVERSSNGMDPRLPSSKKTGVLPELLKNLVERRRMVKSWMKTASGPKLQQLDIQQQALKLTANSMYGCLGSSISRFHAKHLAELITLQGRENLKSTVDLVQNNLNLEVIYGDTDSIMIYSGLDDIAKAKSIAGKVIQEVNKKYRCLEIDLDGVYKRMLLLKKKKYASVKVLFKDGTPYEVIEQKGLDMVRRDWSLLSKELGEFCLSQILSGGTCEDVVETIHNSLLKVQEDARSGQIPLEKYVITKTLTKPPEAYPDGRNQPHVEVALRRKKSGYVTGCSAGDTVPYIICCEQTNVSTTSGGIAQRARHPDELKKDPGNWMVDIDYYLSQQIHPVISRLCAPIQGTSPSRLAECLGLDPSKFQNRSIVSHSEDPSNLLAFALDDEERYQGCEPLVLTCPSCSSTVECSPVFSLLCALIDQKQADNDFWLKMRCPRCPEEGDGGIMSPAVVANQVKRQAERFMSTYYKGLMMCDDETCNYISRSVNLRVLGDSEPGTLCPNYPRCNGHLVRKYTEANLYRQLSYFCYILDTERCIDKIEGEKKVLAEKEIAKIQPAISLASSTIHKIRDRCAYGWIQLNDLFVTSSGR